MGRSGYGEGDCDNNFGYLWDSIVKRAIKGKRGQSFLREMAEAMDAMPVKRLIPEELVSEAGEVCAIGTVCKARGLDVSEVEVWDPEQVSAAVGIARSLAQEIEYQNDEIGPRDETPEQRWVRMRKWVAAKIVSEEKSNSLR